MDRFSPEIQELKRKYTDIFGIQIAGDEYLYRPLTVAEITHAQQLESDIDIEDFYVSSAIVYPEDFDLDDMMAGDVTVLADAVMSVSGILDIDTVKGYLLDARGRIEGDVIHTMKAYIIAAMPQYKDDELDNYSIKQLIDKTVLAEQILTLKQNVMGVPSEGVRVHIYTKEELEEMANKSKKKTKLTREGLEQRIKKERKEMLTGKELADIALKEDLNAIPTDIMEKFVNGADEDDPIARQLFGSR